MELTPEGILKEYRTRSDPAIREQAEMFKKMPPKVQMELLFYMVTNLMRTMQHVHNLIDEEAAETIGIDDLPREH